MNEPYLILDCNYLCHRAKHVFGDLSHDGSATGVIYGFLKDMLSLRERFQSERFVFCWDSAESKRKALWPSYKEHRKKQTELSCEEEKFEVAFRKQMTRLQGEYLFIIGYRNIFCQSGYESDDIIAEICRSLSKEDQAVIVTADQDLYQCIAPNVQWFNPRTKEQLTFKKFQKKFEIRPRQWAVVKAIAGCTSDNVPGIVGIGETRALLYVSGKMKKESKTYQSIKKGWKNIVLRNRPLVELPFSGLKKIHLKSDEVTQEGFNAVCNFLGFGSIRYRRIV